MGFLPALPLQRSACGAAPEERGQEGSQEEGEEEEEKTDDEEVPEATILFA